MVYMVGGENFTRRKKIVLTGAASGAQTDFQRKLEVAYAAAMKSNFDDLRFTKPDFQTLIDAWLETKVDDTSADIWAEFPTTPANTVEQTYYMYYGKADAVSVWDIGATFVFGDDFENYNEGNIVGQGNWANVKSDSGGSANVIAGKKLQMISSGGYYRSIQCSGAEKGILETRIKETASSGDGVIQLGFFDGQIGSSGSKFKNGYAYAPKPSTSIYKTSIRRWINSSRAILIEVSKQIVRDKEYLYQFTWEGYNLVGKLYDAGVEVTGFALSTSDSTFSDESYIGISISSGTIEIDDIRIRKYAANPPTYEFGAEEHQRRTPQFM